MTEKLTVEKQEDGTYLRSDGVVLQPAEKNPFYVLATVYGQHERGYDPELAARNRRIWNGWACKNMSDVLRMETAEDLKVKIYDLRSLEPEEWKKVRAEFDTRLGPDVEIPNPGHVDLAKTHFSDFAVWEKCAFAGSAHFISAHFAKDAHFDKAVFRNSAQFQDACFAGMASFDNAKFRVSGMFYLARFEQISTFKSAHFDGMADFTDQFRGKPACFEKHISFVETEFNEQALFGSVVFNQIANFEKAIFSGEVDFQGGAFRSMTKFNGAEFRGNVPKFFQRDFHDNTVFSVTSDNWPEVSKTAAEDAKEAYRRLRQVSANQHNPESEHFFMRQEMACDAVLKPDRLSRTVIKAFGLFSDYGYSLWRPLVWLVLTWAIGVVFFAAIFARPIISGVPPDGMTDVLGVGSILGLSLSNTVAIFGFRGLYFGELLMQNLPVWVKIIGGTQTVFGFVFLFFLGLGLRNRFRLK